MNRLVTYIWQLLGILKEVSNRCFVYQPHAVNTMAIERGFFEFSVIFGNSHQTVSYNCNINLFPYNFIGVAPEGRNTQMLLYPSDKLNLPSLFVQQQGDIACLECKVICHECLFGDGTNVTDDYPEAIASGKLSEHHYKKMVASYERLHIPVSTVLLDNFIIDSLGQKNNELTENIFSAIHSNLDLYKIRNFKNHSNLQILFFLIKNILQRS